MVDRLDVYPLPLFPEGRDRLDVRARGTVQRARRNEAVYRRSYEVLVALNEPYECNSVVDCVAPMDAQATVQRRVVTGVRAQPPPHGLSTPHEAAAELLYLAMGYDVASPSSTVLMVLDKLSVPRG